jgi:heme/copper-type cytochrome/quinol oxidase subunit 2
MNISRKVLTELAALALPVVIVLLLHGAVPPARAQGVIAVTIKDHRFTPSEIHVKAGQPVELDIKNQDPLAEEFDSTALKIEKVIAGGQQGTVHIRPLDPGRYPFMGEYHSDTAQGVVVAE